MNLGHAIGAQVRESLDDRRENGFWQQIGTSVIRQVREEIELLDAVRYEVWRTQEDERTCPICGQLDGEVLMAGEGYVPPLHDHCRCRRIYHHTEFRSRLVERWRDVPETTLAWVWHSTA